MPVSTYTSNDVQRNRHVRQLELGAGGPAARGRSQHHYLAIPSSGLPAPSSQFPAPFSPFPGIVDHEAPGPVHLTPQHIRIPARELHRLTLGTGARKGPLSEHQGEIEFAVQGDEFAERVADAS